MSIKTNKLYWTTIKKNRKIFICREVKSYDLKLQFKILPLNQQPNEMCSRKKNDQGQEPTIVKLTTREITNKYKREVSIKTTTTLWPDRRRTQ